MKHMRHIAKEVDDWTRFEAEFTGSYAHQLTDAIKKCSDDQELKSVILSALLDRYMFFYVKSNRPHKLTRLMIEMLDEKNFHFESPSPRNNLLDQSIDHLIKGSGLFPTMWKVQEIWGGRSDLELLKYLYKQYIDNFQPNDDHQGFVSKFKDIYLLDGKPFEQNMEDD